MNGRFSKHQPRCHEPAHRIQRQPGRLPHTAVGYARSDGVRCASYGGSVWEPCANRGHMVKPLHGYFDRVYASDIHDYGCGYKVYDFLSPGPLPPTSPDWVVTNPPFKSAEEFIDRSLLVASRGVAIFIRSTFLESVGRYNRLFSCKPPSVVAQFSERVVLHKGKLSPKGSTATAYCWIVWDHSNDFGGNTKLVWIPPCRKSLELESDYL